MACPRGEQLEWPFTHCQQHDTSALSDPVAGIQAMPIAKRSLSSSDFPHGLKREPRYHRREILRVGAASAFGLTLPQWLSNR
ncbi:MAG: hypothetical protein VYC71_15360, partial [Planctomycetota bacterium]|nr:hypothetical protein [Planctomycetota bacterium]